LAVWNAAVWAIGNGLASTTLVVYLARELHAERLGLGIGLIVAASQMAGLLRLGAPALIEQVGGRKRFCLAAFLLSAALLLALPWACAPGRLPSPGWSLAALILLWCLYHLFQYLATVALWSWLAYAGLNVGLPNLLLKLSPERSNGPYIAAFYAATGLCYAASTVLGGLLVDRYGAEGFRFAESPWLSFFPCLFLVGWLMRSLGAGLLLLVVEPKAERKSTGEDGKKLPKRQTAACRT
jgi:hypothetical protein